MSQEQWESAATGHLGSIWDKLVEKCIQLVLEPHCETQFVPSSLDSGGYKSALYTMRWPRSKTMLRQHRLLSQSICRTTLEPLTPDMAYREMWHIGIGIK